MRIGWEYYKAHGLGNDYLVFREAGPERPDGWEGHAPLIERVCDRWKGPSGDGIVVLLGDGDEPSPPFRLRMFNPDGSEFERSGNGLRVFGAFAAAKGWVGSEPFAVEVGGDRVGLRIVERLADGRLDVSVDMGRTSHGPEAVALDPEHLGDGQLDIGEGEAVAIVPVSVGNPHAVCFDQPMTDERLHRVGPALTSHPGFAHGTNVQLAQVVDDRTLEALIWERGVGVTASSGTSACAVASAAVHTGRIPAGELAVRMPGGTMFVTVDTDSNVTLRGVVQPVCEGRLDPAIFADLS